MVAGWKFLGEFKRARRKSLSLEYFTLRGLVAELAERGLKVDYRCSMAIRRSNRW
jgi:hypothetical protein